MTQSEYEAMLAKQAELKRNPTSELAKQIAAAHGQRIIRSELNPVKLGAPLKRPPVIICGNATAEIMREAAKLGIQPSTDEEKLNKTEKAYLAWIRNQQPLFIGIQCITLKLGADTRYTPDFAIVDAHGMRLVDVKGVWSDGKMHVEDDARAKIHVAARLFTMFIFQYAFRDGLIFQHRNILR